jgi:hypothetical protein
LFRHWLRREPGASRRITSGLAADGYSVRPFSGLPIDPFPRAPPSRCPMEEPECAATMRPVGQVPGLPPGRGPSKIGCPAKQRPSLTFMLFSLPSPPDLPVGTASPILPATARYAATQRQMTDRMCSLHEGQRASHAGRFSFRTGCSNRRHLFFQRPDSARWSIFLYGDWHPVFPCRLSP